MSKFIIRYHIEEIEDDYSRRIHIYCAPTADSHLPQEDLAIVETRLFIARLRDAYIIREDDSLSVKFWWHGKPDDWWFEQGGNTHEQA